MHFKENYLESQPEQEVVDTEVQASTIFEMNENKTCMIGFVKFTLCRLADQPSEQLSFRSNHRWKRP